MTAIQDPDSAATETSQVVVFRMEGESFGVDIFRVNEIIRLHRITPLPNAADHLLGLVNLRGKTVPVFDLRRRLGLPVAEPTDASRIVVVEAQQDRVGVLVDEVSEVLTVPTEDFETPPDSTRGDGDECVAKVVRHQDRLITYLDLDQVLAA